MPLPPKRIRCWVCHSPLPWVANRVRAEPQPPRLPCRALRNTNGLPPTGWVHALRNMNHVLTLGRLRSSTFPLARPTMFHTGAPTHPHYPLRPSRAFMVVCGRPSARVPTKRSHAYRGTSSPAIHPRACHFFGRLDRLKPSLPAAKPQRTSPRGAQGGFAAWKLAARRPPVA